MNRLNALVKLCVIARGYGLTVDFPDDARRDHWWFANRKITIAISRKRVPYDDDYINELVWYLAHEISHFLVAPLSRCYKTNYGNPTYLEEAKAHLAGAYLRNRVYGKPFVVGRIPAYDNSRPNETTGVRRHRKRAEAWFKREGKKKVNAALERGL